MSAAWLPNGFDPDRLAIVTAALDLVGIAEMPKGSNRSPTINQWNATCGAPQGSPWCAAFASYCATQGRVAFASAACEDWHQWARARGQWRPSGPTPGDLVLFAFDPAASAHADHCGVVVRSDSGYLFTVEGNTNADGGREGYVVLLHDRSATPALGFVVTVP